MIKADIRGVATLLGGCVIDTHQVWPCADAELGHEGVCGVPALLMSRLASVVHGTTDAVLDTTAGSETLLETDVTLFAMLELLYM